MKRILTILVLTNWIQFTCAQVIDQSKEQIKLTIASGLENFNMDRFFNKKISKDSTDKLKNSIKEDLLKKISLAVDPILLEESKIQNYLAKLSLYQDPMQKGVETIFTITSPSLLKNDCDDTKRKILEIFNANWRLVLNYNNDLQKYMNENPPFDNRLKFVTNLIGNLNKEILYVKAIVNIHESTIINWNSNPEITTYLKKIGDNQKYIDLINTMSFQLNIEISKGKIIRFN